MLLFNHQGKKTLTFFLKLYLISSLKACALQHPHIQKNKESTKGIEDHILELLMKGRLEESIFTLYSLNPRKKNPNSHAYAAMLQACVDRKALLQGKLIHAHIILNGHEPDIYLGTKLVVMYAKAGSPTDARKASEEIPQRNVYSWTAMIAGYAQIGFFEEALEIFFQMQKDGIEPNNYTFSSVLPACANLGALEHGRRIHEKIIRGGFQSNLIVASALIDMYIKCGCGNFARQLFDDMPERSLVTWNSMLAGYVQSGKFNEAIGLFEKMPQRDVVSWSVMIAGCAQSGQCEKALGLVREMQMVHMRMNSDSYTSLLPACAGMGDLSLGREVHGNIIRSGFQSNRFVGSALVDMYAKFRCVEEAHKVFDQMRQQTVFAWNSLMAGYTQVGDMGIALGLFRKMSIRNVVSWTIMIAGYVQSGKFNIAIALFQELQLTGVNPDPDIFSTVLPACANLAALKAGTEIHEHIIRYGFHSSIFVANSLIDMYAKSGSIENALKVFEKMPARDVISCTTMIIGYSTHGRGKEAIQIFQQMQQTRIKPESSTFLGVLHACCHSGLVEEGCQYFHRMSQDYHITPEPEHYSCMVDILARAGHLEKANEFILKMPIEPDAAVWGSLLGSCISHVNLELGEWVAERVLEFEPENAAHYVLLSNIYAAVGRWSEVEKVRKMMKEKRIKKMPGCSWIEVNNETYVFVRGDGTISGNAQNPSKIQNIVQESEGNRAFA